MVLLRKPLLQSLALCLSVFCCTIGMAAATQLQSDTDESTAGYYQLSWNHDQSVQLVEAKSIDFSDRRVIYAGTDTARVMSGKSDGRWYYRLELVATGEPASETITVTVKHHSLARAGFFFGLGAFVFFATLGLILHGQRKARLLENTVDR